VDRPLPTLHFHVQLIYYIYPSKMSRISEILEVSRQSANVGCLICKESCYNQCCLACRSPLCHQCVSRPHQCASRRAGVSARKAEARAGTPNGARDLHAESALSDAEARETSISSINSEAEAREISSSSMNSTDSASRRPWHMSDPSQALFSQYFQMKAQQQDDKCVTQ
jgi:hypothetical protein